MRTGTALARRNDILKPLARTCRRAKVIVLEIWPEFSFTIGEMVLFREDSNIFLAGKVIGYRQGRGGQTVYCVQVGVGRIVIKTKRELSR